MAAVVKEEIPYAEAPLAPRRRVPGPAAPPPDSVAVIDLSSSDSDSDAEQGSGGGKRSRVPGGASDEAEAPVKKSKTEEEAALPLGFLDPLPLEEPEALPLPPPEPAPRAGEPPKGMEIVGCKQFWKAGEYEGGSVVDPTPVSVVGMDHVRVHPKFLHSNATSHKWALGALAELLDNSLDEVCNGATYVNIDMLENRKDGSRMLLIEDNGGGMDPDKMRQCMSLGYSAKSKVANTIGQYGNGFKTSTMRLGADVVVFSRSSGKDGRSPTQSIGMLSYTFLRDTGKEDIVVPMLDFEKVGQNWSKMRLSSSVDWNKNLETILQWSPYSSEADLLEQFSSITDQGTRIVIYNLWEDDQGELELDFDSDRHDIQIRGVNRDEQKIEMAEKFPNSRHFLTYRHSLRSYASILYLRLPHGFRMILRAKEIEHHNIVNDMMMKQEVTYRPQPNSDGVPKDPNMVAVVTMGFVKDAKDHIDVQGFNVYHKNRLIKPFWRVWNAAGSDGRGVIGVLEANFIEPAHDKQDFERTIVLSRLEARLIQLQKQYWSTNCHRIGYAPRRNRKLVEAEKGSPPSTVSQPSGKSQDSTRLRNAGKLSSNVNSKSGEYATSPIGSTKTGFHRSGNLASSREKKIDKFGKNKSSPQSRRRETTSCSSEESEPEVEYVSTQRHVNKAGGVGENRVTTRLNSKVAVVCNGNRPSHEDYDLGRRQLKDENDELKERIKKLEESMSRELQFERDRNKSLTEQLEAANKRLEEANKEQEALIDIFSEERSRRDREEENLRKKLKDASLTIQELLDKLSCRNNLKP